MAERRMFAKTITGSDMFLEMPQSSQCLYFHLNMRADDDGFVNSPRAIMREVGCKEDDMRILALKKFIIPFDNGIVVIKHWRINNYIQNDRYNETKYKEEKARLVLDENKAYRLADNQESQSSNHVYIMDTQVRLGKDRLELGKDSIDGESEKPMANNFTPPTLQQVIDYCNERQNNVDPYKWHDYYISNGWKVGKNPMKDWKAAVRTWERNNKKGSSKPNGMSQLEAMIRGDSVDR